VVLLLNVWLGWALTHIDSGELIVNSPVTAVDGAQVPSRVVVQ
jgi:hypothetical protein